MATTQTCDKCGAVVSNGFEGFGARAGVGDIIFDLCDECSAKLKTYVIEEFIPAPIDGVVIDPVAPMLDGEREKRAKAEATKEESAEAVATEEVSDEQ
jgi:hypothetical protein